MLDAEYHNKTRNKITMKNLKTIREQNKYNQVKLSHLVSISQSSIVAYENNAKIPSLPTLINLADALDTSLDYLVDRTDNPLPIKHIGTSLSKEESLLLSQFNKLSSINKEKLKSYLLGLMGSDNDNN